MDSVVVSSRYEPSVTEKLRSQRISKWGDSNIQCCTYYCFNGNCIWTNWDDGMRSLFDWQGQEGLEESGTIGLLQISMKALYLYSRTAAVLAR